jgi:hypothetical protein
MKKLQRKYKKKLLQKIQVYIGSCEEYNKTFFEVYRINLIGFNTEYYSPIEIEYKYNFCNKYTHSAHFKNQKLYTKFDY